MPSGRKPGTPKTGGRVAGTPNRVTSELKAYVREISDDGRAYIDRLHSLANDMHPDAHARLKAIGMLLERGWGKPTEHIELSGPDGGPIEVHDHFAVPAPR